MDALGALEAILARWKELRLAVVPLRTKRVSEEDAFDGGDYDFLVDPGDLDSATDQILRVSRERLGSASLDRSFPGKVEARLRDSLRHETIALDLWVEAQVPAGEGRTVYVRWAHLRRHLADGPSGPSLPPELEALLYLCHLESRNKDPALPQILRRLTSYAVTIGVGRASRADGDSRARLLDLVAEVASDPSRRAAVALASGRILLASGVGHDSVPWHERLSERAREAVRRRAWGWLPRPIVAVVGPDGAGKTSLVGKLPAATGLATRSVTFKHVVRFNRAYAWFSRILPAYRRLPENVADERYGRFLFPLALAAFGREIPPAPSGGVLLVDRYFHDLLFQDVRSRNRRARLGFAGRIEAGIFPLPDLVLHLYGDPGEIAARKSEISSRNVAIYQDLCLGLYQRRRAPRLAIVSTDSDLEESLAFSADLVRRVCRAYAVAPPRPVRDRRSCTRSTS